MIGRAGFWRRAVAAGVDLILALLLCQGVVALLFAASGGHVTIGSSLYTACRPAPGLPTGLVLPAGYGASRHTLCTSSILGAPTSILFVATHEERIGTILWSTQFSVPVSPDGRTLVRVLSLDALFYPAFLILRWAADRFWRGSPGRRLVRIAVTDAGGTASAADLPNILALRYARFAWIYLPGSAMLAVAACWAAVTGSVPHLVNALSWFAGNVWVGAAQIAAMMAIIRRQDTAYDAAAGSVVATRLEIARASDMYPDARVARRPGPIDDLRRAIDRTRARLPLASCALVAAMILVFVGETTLVWTPASPIGVSLETLAAWGGMDRELAFLSWQPYRLLAAIFLHANVTHLVVNALALLVVGFLLEPWLGPTLFVVIFLACGLAGSLASVTFNAPLIVSVGASGAVLGLFAAAFALAWRAPAGSLRRWLLAWPMTVCIPALVPGIKLPDAFAVDIPDHAGGEAAGLLIGIALALCCRNGVVRAPSRRAVIGVAALASLVLAGTVAVGGLRAPEQAARLIPPGEIPANDDGWKRAAEVLVARYPEDPRARYGLALREADDGLAAQAVKDLDVAIAMQRRLSPARAGDFRFAAHASVGANLFGAGNLDAAIVQYGAALEERPEASLYRQRGIAEFYRGRATAAVEDLRRALVTNPKEAYSILWLSIVAERTGLSDPIAATARDADLDKWPGQIIRFFDGTMRRDVMEATAGALDLVSDEHRVCEAGFYVAEWHIMHREYDAARPLLQQALAKCPRTFIEYRAAAEELAGHGGLPPA